MLCGLRSLAVSLGVATDMACPGVSLSNCCGVVCCVSVWDVGFVTSIIERHPPLLAGTN